MNHKSQNIHSGSFDVVALAASAGGHKAIHTVLHALPAEFSVPIIVMMHLGAESTSTTEVIGRRLPFPVEWVKQDSKLTPGKVLICPPKSFVELLPDGTFVLSSNERGAVDKPIDLLFESMARSFGERAVGVILTGMQNDGSLGARQLHLAGGRVLVQSESSAEFPDMPKATIQAGAADLVVPLQDIGQVIGEMVDGTPRPKARSELEAIRRVFGEKGEVAMRAREIDWSQTPLGPAINWPESLRLITRTTLDSAYPMLVWWGPDFIQIYNEAWRNFLGSEKHPQALGGRARETWSDLWRQVGPMAERVMSLGEAMIGENYPILINRSGYLEEVFVSFSYTPIRNADDNVLGVHIMGWDTTKNVVAERQMRALQALASKVAGASTPREACERAVAALESDPADIPFALLYLLDDARKQSILASAAGVEAGSAAAPHVIHVADEGAVWPLRDLLAETPAQEGGLLLDDLTERVPDLHLPAPSLAGTLSPRTGILLPLRPVADKPPIGVLVAGLSPHRPFDEEYRSFLNLAVQQINAGLAEAKAKQLERERHERLAELDSAKTEFFANVSHEFRTPLTLLLAPLEDLLRRRDELPVSLAEEVEVAANNSRRLLRLVNNLLDFSQIESRREQANFEPTDLCALTMDIASVFRSSIEAAGLNFRVECDRDVKPVWVDRDMWEKILSNLLSNAFKFTFEGEIAVELHALSLHAELIVKDTGIGIPAEEMPNLFKRFHRIRGARSRTVEGSGIGLSIVDDLVKRLGGQLRARSTENKGTEFTIWIPYKSFRMKTESTTNAEFSVVRQFARELAHDASRWLADAETIPAEVMDDLLGSPPENDDTQQGKILVVDDNADLRNYLQRLLSPRWEVELAADGESALKSAIRTQPEIILADVMMPGLDGFELIQRLREHAQLKHTPVILLTARAGEEGAIQGLLAGANDYIAKPFSPRELVARIQAAVERARAEQALRESEEKFRTLFDSIDEGFLIQEMVRDESGRAIDFRLREINRAYTRQTGLGNDLVGKLASEYVPNLERFWIDLFDRVARTGTPERVESFNQATDRWYNVHVSRAGRDDRRVAIVFEDITQRKRREAHLAFLAEVSQDLAGLTSINETMDALGAKIGAFFHVSRVVFGEISEDGETGVVNHEWRTADLPSMKGTYRTKEYFTPEFELLHRRGEIAVVRDVAEDERVDAKRYGPLGVGAFVGVPLIRREKWRFYFSLLDSQPRDWREDEIELVREITSRIWARLERARAEQALRESEEKYRTLFDSIDEGFCIIEVLFDEKGEPFDYRFLETNPAFIRQTGIENGIGRTVREFAPDHEKFWFDIYGEIARTGAPKRFENQAKALNPPRFYDVYAFRLGGAGENRVAVIFNDITERKQSERKLTRTNQLLQATFDNSLQIIQLFKAVRDERGDIVDFEWLMTNKQWNDRWGEMAGKRLLTQNPAVIETGLFDEFKQVTETGVPLTQEHYYNYEQFDGWFLQTVAKVEDGFLLSTLDITEHKRREVYLAFLADISQDLAQLTKVDETTAALSRKIGEFFKVSRVNFAVINEVSDEAVIIHEWHVEGLKDTSGERVYRLGSFISEDFYRSARAGEMLVVRDTRTDPRTTDAAYAEIDTRSFVTAPFVRNGEWQFLISIAKTVPRDWQEYEIELLREITNRIWWRLERARAEEALRVSEEKYRTLFETMSQGYVECELIRDPQGRAIDYRIITANAQFERLTGVPVDMTLRHTARELVPGLPQAWIDTYERIVRTREPESFERPGGGQGRWFAIHAYPREGDVVAVLYDDITQRKQAEAALYESRARLAVEAKMMRDLYEASRQIFAAPNLHTALEEILESSIHLLEADMGNIQLYDAEHGVLEIAMQRGFQPEFVNAFQIVTPDNNTACGRSIRSGERVVIEDVELDADYSPYRQIAAEADYRAVQSTPLFDREGKLLGVISTHWRRPHRPSDADLLKLDLYARQAIDLIIRVRTDEALREALKAARQSEERYRAFVMASSDVVYRMSPDWKEMRYLKGKGFLEDTEDPSALWIEKYIPEEDRLHVLSIIEEAIRNKSIFELEHRVIRADGTIGWTFSRAVPLLNEQGEIVEWIGTASEVTDRRRAEDALQLQALLLDTVEQSVIATDLEGKIIYWNKYAEELFGWKAGEVIGRNIIGVTTRDKNEKAEEIMSELLKGKRWSGEFTLQRRDGTAFPAYVSDVPIYNSEGNITGIVGVAVDITERKQMEESLLSHEKQLQLLNESLERKVQEQTTEVHSLASKVIKSTQRERKRISQILHDDLQQRIFAIQMQLSFLLAGLQDENDTTRREAADIGEELANILKITRDLSIDLSPPILAGEGLVQAIGWLASRMQQQYGLHIEIQASGSFVLPDEELHVFLFNCVRELLFNIVKHAETHHAVVALQWVEADLQIEVRDSGKGFQMKTAEKEGEFIQPRLSLGLATMQHQLSLFGGSMRIKSEPGAGTQIILIVPMSEGGSEVRSSMVSNGG